MSLQNYCIDATYSFKFSNSIKDIEIDWSNIRHANVYLTYRYLKAIECSVGSNLKFVYVVVYKHKDPVGILYFQWIEITKSFFTQDKFPEEIHVKKSSKLLKKLNGNLLLCGNFFATGPNGFYFKDDISVAIIPVLIEKLQKKLKELETPLKVNFVMFKEFWKDQDSVLQASLKEKYTSFGIDVNMVLSIAPNWYSYNDYLGEMNTKYRTRAKSVLKKTKDVVVQDFSLEKIKEHESTIDKLYSSVVKEASFNLAKLSGKSFYEFKKELKEDFIFTGYFFEGNLVAFSSGCITNNCLDANYVGIDYGLNKSIPLYQRILSDYVQTSILKKVNVLRLGRTAEIMKSSLGAKPVEMKLYVKHTNPILHTLFKPLIKYIKPSSYEVRNPFKNLKN